MTDEIIEGEVRDLTVVEPREMLNATRTPEGTVDLATRLAAALFDIVERQHLFATISGKKFPTVEAWMTIARMDNVVAREVVGGIVRHPDDSYEAMVELIRLSDGMIVGRGSALCGTPGDSPWDKRPLPVRRSMAVTRATSRAFRQQYSWIMALAGYEATPAEEMGEESPPPRGRASAPQGAPPTRQVAPTASSSPREAPGASETGDDVLEAGIIQAVVSEKPESHVRIVKDGHTEKRWEGERAKLELITKVGNRKHTGILLGPLAEAAAIADIDVGEVVRFVGAVVEEIKWAEDKPTKKEIIGVPPTYMIGDLMVMRGGEWWSVNQAMPTLLPAADAATPTPPSTAPTLSTPASTSQPASTTAPSDQPGRMKGTTGEWATLAGKLVDPVQFTVKGTTPVAILRVADTDTGEIIMAALGADIEQQVGTAAAPFIKPGDGVSLYGEWKGDWLVVEMAGKTAVPV